MGLRNAFCGLRADRRLVLVRQEMAPGGKALGFGGCQQLRFVGFALDVADRGHCHAVSRKHAADRDKSDQAHEKIAHTAGVAADIGRLGEHDFEFGHHLPANRVEVGKVRLFAQHRLGKVETLAHRGL